MDFPQDLTPLVEVVQYETGNSSYHNMSNIPLDCTLTARNDVSGKSPNLSHPIYLNTTGYSHRFTLDPQGNWHYARDDVAFIQCKERDNDPELQ